MDQYGQLPLYFIENKGQVAERVAYYLEGKDTSVYFAADGVMFALSGAQTQEQEPSFVPASYSESAGAAGWAVKLEFVGANSEARPMGVDRTGTIVSYFKGSTEDWKTGVPTYADVMYKNLWPGIDLVYTRQTAV